MRRLRLTLALSLLVLSTLACNLPTGAATVAPLPSLPPLPTEPPTATAQVATVAPADPTTTPAPLGPTPAPADPAPPTSDRPIVFVEPVPEIYGGLGNIATIQPNGSNYTLLTTYNYNRDPLLSPNGQWIAYRSVPRTIVDTGNPADIFNSENYNIWLITPDGSTAVQLTSNPDVRSAPVWSHDSQWVYYIEGVDRTLIQHNIVTNERFPIRPGVSFVAPRPNDLGLAYVAIPDGMLYYLSQTDQTTQLTFPQALGPNRVIDAVWFPDGAHIAFTTADETERIEGTTLGIVYAAWTVSNTGASGSQIASDIQRLRVSPDGRYLAGFTGSGYGDACSVDWQLTFLQFTATDRKSAVRIAQDQLPLPAFNAALEGGMWYPSFTYGEWYDPTTFINTFNLTCANDYSSVGLYAVYPDTLQLTQLRAQSPF